MANCVWFLLVISTCVSVGANSVQDDHIPTQGEARPKRSDDTSPLEAVVSQLTKKMAIMEAQMEAQTQSLQSLQNGQGSTFIRWGKSSCPSSSQIVYSGFVGGSFHSDAGGSAKHLCLSPNPVMSDLWFSAVWHSTLYGAEYEAILNLNDLDVVCAVCKVSKASTFMLPGTNVCPSGWTTQYSGFLVGATYHHADASDYTCMDGQSEGRPGSEANQDGNVFYYTVAVCGSLPCPPYVNNKVVTCAVCSQ